MPGVLVVDDESDMRLLVEAVIERANDGLEVVGLATSGAEAIAQSQAIRPDLILLDHQMPDMTGLEAAKEILDQRPDQRIILFSAFLDAEIRARASELGILTCLHKNEVSRVPEALWRFSAD